jgi:hypothetical protein
VEELMEIPGIGEKTSQKLLTIAAQLLEEKARQIEADEAAAQAESGVPQLAEEPLPGALIVNEEGVTPVVPGQPREEDRIETGGGEEDDRPASQELVEEAATRVPETDSLDEEQAASGAEAEGVHEDSAEPEVEEHLRQGGEGTEESLGHPEGAPEEEGEETEGKLPEQG